MAIVTVVQKLCMELDRDIQSSRDRATGRSTLVTDCTILEGNPADSTLAQQMIDRQIEILGGPPKQVVYDGAFASKANLDSIKAKGVEDVASQKRDRSPSPT